MAANDQVSPKRLLSRYLGKVSAPAAEDVRASVWTPQVDAARWGGQPGYSNAILEQYKVYVEMADRISARRGLTNTFFLTLNSGVFTVIGVVWTSRTHTTSWLLIFPVLVLIGQCLACSGLSAPTGNSMQPSTLSLASWRNAYLPRRTGARNGKH